MAGLVLLYHRVVHIETDPQLLAVTPKHFAEQMEVLRKIATPIRLSEMVHSARTGALPEQAVAVTFDDGYADNLHEAEPILKRYGTPATVFATTGNTNSAQEFFWDELDRLLLQPGKLPETLQLAGSIFSLRACTEYSKPQWESEKSWNVLVPAAPGSRQHLYLDLCGLIHRSKADQRAVLLDHLRTWAGIGSAGRESHRMMNENELREIEAGGVVDLGAHTVTHPVLAQESPQKQRAEIASSKNALEEILHHPVRSFSYPFGTRRDYSPATVDFVREAGFELACSNFVGRVKVDADPYQLPRYIVRDWAGPEFEQQLVQWFSSGN